MNRMVFFALGLVIAARAGIALEASHTAASPADLRTVVVRAQWLIDGVADKPRHSMEIVIRDNRIVDVRPANSQALPAAAQVIDLGAATVLPGLIDAHTHIFLQGEDPAAGGYDIQLLKYPLAFRAARATVSLRHARSRRPADIRLKATRRRSKCRRACRSLTDRSRRARPRASSSTTARTG